MLRVSVILLALFAFVACNDAPQSFVDEPAATDSESDAPLDERVECDDAYPDDCIAPYPPDLDCSDMPYRRFTVLRPDPHEFDRDRDGTGCEVD